MAADSRTDNATTAFNPFGDLSKTFEQFKMPGVDMSAFVDARRKDVEALVEANKVAYEAMQALAKTQTDMLTQAMQGMQAAASGALAGGAKGGPGADIGKQTEAAQQAWQKMLADMKGLADLAQKTQADAMASLTERANAGMTAMKDLAKPK